MMIDKSQKNRIFLFSSRNLIFRLFADVLKYKSKYERSLVWTTWYMNIFTWNKDIKILDVIQNDFVLLIFAMVEFVLHALVARTKNKTKFIYLFGIVVEWIVWSKIIERIPVISLPIEQLEMKWKENTIATTTQLNMWLYTTYSICVFFFHFSFEQHFM